MCYPLELSSVPAGPSEVEVRGVVAHKAVLFPLVVILGVVAQAGGPRLTAQSASTNPALPTVITDSFDDPEDGVLPRSCSNPAQRCGYVDGEYQLAKVDAAANTSLAAFIPGAFGDAMI